MRFEVIPLGTGAALPAQGRSPSAQVVRREEALYLVDCGEGTQERLRMAGLSFMRIGHVFISHLHGDHYFGLMGLLSTMHLLGRTRELHVHGPAALKPIIDVQLQASATWLRYPLHVHPVADDAPREVLVDAHLTVTSLPLRHRLPTTGFLVRERPGPRRLRPERIADIPHFLRTAVKNGSDLRHEDGTVTPNVELTFDPLPPRAYAYCSDTAHHRPLVEWVRDVDLLYHEATFTRHLAARARETMHSTAAEAATIARDAGVGALLLGHFSSRYKDPAPLLLEALEVFPRVALSEEGRSYPIGRSIVDNSFGR